MGILESKLLELIYLLLLLNIYFGTDLDELPFSVDKYLDIANSRI